MMQLVISFELVVDDNGLTWRMLVIGILKGFHGKLSILWRKMSSFYLVNWHGLNDTKNDKVNIFRKLVRIIK